MSIDAISPNVVSCPNFKGTEPKADVSEIEADKHNNSNYLIAGLCALSALAIGGLAYHRINNKYIEKLTDAVGFVTKSQEYRHTIQKGKKILLFDPALEAKYTDKLAHSETGSYIRSYRGFKKLQELETCGSEMFFKLLSNKNKFLKTLPKDLQEVICKEKDFYKASEMYMKFKNPNVKL